MSNIAEAKALLKRHFGHSEFRPGQLELIEAVLSKQDVMGVMPTGAGKSIIYQIPALMGEGLTVVVSPLISLMKDQVIARREAGIEAACINSNMSMHEIYDACGLALTGLCKLLYVAPERLETPRFQSLISQITVDMVAVDEAHCVSQWGQDFRPSYLGISPFVESLPARPVMIALTATATAFVRDDIIQALKLKNPHVLVSGFDRPNLMFAVERPEPKEKETCLLKLIKQRAARKDAPGGAASGQTGIVYCSTRNTVEDICDLLRRKGYAATRYHAGLSAAERHQNQEDFLYDRATIMVATNAFGMGIDKSNVGFVIHYNMPSDLEGYYQEAGRAGRDGSPADCILIYNKKDVQTCQFLIDLSRDNNLNAQKPFDEVERLYERDCERLKRMTFYCTTTDCLRSTILRYFGEKDAPFRCEHCSNCSTDIEERDVTIDAQKIVSCVARIQRMGRQVGKSSIIDVLRGSTAQKICDWHFNELSTYGIMKDESAMHIRYVFDSLIDKGYLAVTSGQYPTVFMTTEGLTWLTKTKEPFIIKIAKRTEKIFKQDKKGLLANAAPHSGHKSAGSAKSAAKQTPKSVEEAGTFTELFYDAQLYEELRKLRTQIAAEEQVPAYIVFSNASLADMATKKPLDEDAFLDVMGVGVAKAAKYGTRFVSCIKKYLG